MSGNELAIVIDCNEPPYCPPDWEVVEHKPLGLISPSAITLYRSPNVVTRRVGERWLQQRRRCIFGAELCTELEGHPQLNACFIDFYLDNPELAPQEWGELSVFGTGTRFRHPGGGIYVACLRRRFNGAGLQREFRWIGHAFLETDPVALVNGVN
ncbi:MAG: hypothetical protein Q8Q20_03330 [bacterium]|nr:hypothetical protein [bacterium]